jgi:hypothetical protein
MMGIKVGLWIDHRKAIIVKLTDQGEKIEQIESQTEKQLRRLGETPLKGPFDVLHVPADSVRQRSFTTAMNAYYDAIIASIQPADAVFIMGPSEARDELKKRMEKNSLDKCVTGVERVGWMTQRQIAAKVRRLFAE